MILFGYINVGFTPLLLHESLELTCEFEQRQVRDLIVEVGGEIIVLRIAHAHLVLQHLCHGCYALTIAVACHLIYIFMFLVQNQSLLLRISYCKNLNSRLEGAFYITPF